ncbi:MAG: hypothetical protein DMF61_02580 [Blastocatellia bacterium AA13]|nr:MAG: hypothetical protein DMF61_02580 [Blastocatellia bacterium AA13]
MTDQLISFTSLAEAPTHYAREPVASYGTRGLPHTFRCTSEFLTKLETCFAELWSVAPLGRAEVVTSAGAFVEKPGFHGLGRAFDLDAIFWSERDFVTLRFLEDTRFYLGIEAILRKHFGTVLNFLYNSDHHDHLHCDDSTDVGFVRTSRSRVLFVQAAVTHVLNIPVDIDGQFGPQTDRGIIEALEQLEITGDILETSVWLEFLSRLSAAAL